MPDKWEQYAEKPADRWAQYAEQPPAESLARTIFETPGRGANEAFQGLKDVITPGSRLKGAHEIMSGVGKAALPFVPFSFAAAPVATLGGMAGGALGNLAGRGIADASGASPEATDVASDVGGLLGGGLGAGSRIRGAASKAIRPITETLSRTPGGAFLRGAGEQVATEVPPLFRSASFFHPLRVLPDVTSALGRVYNAGKTAAGVEAARPAVPRIGTTLPVSSMAAPSAIEPIRAPLPSGRTVGPVTPTPPPARTPVHAGLTRTEMQTPAPIEPIRAPLPSGRSVGGLQNQARMATDVAGPVENTQLLNDLASGGSFGKFKDFASVKDPAVKETIRNAARNIQSENIVPIRAPQPQRPVVTLGPKEPAVSEAETTNRDNAAQNIADYLRKSGVNAEAMDLLKGTDEDQYNKWWDTVGEQAVANKLVKNEGKYSPSAETRKQIEDIMRGAKPRPVQ